MLSLENVEALKESLSQKVKNLKATIDISVEKLTNEVDLVKKSKSKGNCHWQNS